MADKKTVKSDLSGADWTYFDHESPVNGKVKMFTKFLPEYTTVLPDKYIILSGAGASTIDLLNLHDIKLQKQLKILYLQSLHIDSQSINGRRLLMRGEIH